MRRISRSSVGACQIGDDELKRWPALLQCLLGLQCQSRPSAAHIREDGLQSRIWRVCAHPLTVSGPKPAFKWSKHRRSPKCGEQSDPDDQAGSGKEHSPDATLSHTGSFVPHVTHAVCPVLDAAHLILSWCCADHTHSVPRYCPSILEALWTELEEGDGQKNGGRSLRERGQRIARRRSAFIEPCPPSSGRAGAIGR